MPLSTLVHCYEAECEPLPVDSEDGVPLEHLITCVKGIQIQPGITGIKSVVMVSNEDEVRVFFISCCLARFITVIFPSLLRVRIPDLSPGRPFPNCPKITQPRSAEEFLSLSSTA